MCTFEQFEMLNTQILYVFRINDNFFFICDCILHHLFYFVEYFFENSDAPESNVKPTIKLLCTDRYIETLYKMQVIKI